MRFANTAQVHAIEVATGSHIYNWEPSGAAINARKLTLFPNEKYEDVSTSRKFLSLFKATRRCDTIFFGIGYNELYIILLAFVLRMLGKRVVMMTDSKFDDSPRSIRLELVKSVLLSVFHGAIVAGYRQQHYIRFLGFYRRPVLLGYDCISGERIRRQAAQDRRPLPAWDERPFVCVGRMVPKKNLFALVEAFAIYTAKAGPQGRKLVLVGSGPQRDALQERADALGVAAKIEMTGFLQAEDIAMLLARALSLVLVSTEEQWGLVVNEAVALGLPVIVSEQVGARDLLVNNLLNGFVVSAYCPEAIAQAMLAMADNETDWRGMSAQSSGIAKKGDAKVFAEAVAAMNSI